jgi:serine/threonine protein phosphatase PrpC
MLDGSWQQHGWTSGEPSRGALLEPASGASLEPAIAASEIRAVGVSDRGKVREINEDSFACRDDIGVWLIADGLGGHEAGELASRMVTSVIDDLEESTLDLRIEELARTLRVVNGCLRVLAERSSTVSLAGSTVAALMIEGPALACIWAGDSRVYRFRDGLLEQLSRDHSEAQNGVADRHVITRAVGGDAELQLDVARGDVRGADRFLLCTDGLYGEVAPDDMARALSLPSPEEACAALLDMALRNDAPDNLTGIVVHVSARA